MAAPQLIPAQSYVTVNADGTGTYAYLVFDSNLDKSILPSTSAFTLLVNGTSVKLTGTPVVTQANDLVTASSSTADNTLKLALPNAVQNGQNIVISYKDPTTANDIKSVLQGTDGADVSSFYTQPLLNKAVVDVTAPSYATYTIPNKAVANTIVLHFDDILDAALPLSSAFKISVNGKTVAATDVMNIATAQTDLLDPTKGSDLTLTLNPNAYPDLSTLPVELTYTDPTKNDDANALQVGGVDKASFSTSTSVLKLHFDQVLDPVTLPATSTLKLTINGTTSSVKSISTTVSDINDLSKGSDLFLNLDPKTAFGLDSKRIDLTYTDPTTKDDAKALQDVYGNDVATYTTTIAPVGMNLIAPVLTTADATTTPYLVVSLDKPIDVPNDAAGKAALEKSLASLFTASINSKTAKVTGVSIVDAQHLNVSLDSQILNGQTVNLTYTDKTAADDASGVLQSPLSAISGGVDVATTTLTATGGIIQTNSVAPSASEASVINSKQIEIKFKENGLTATALEDQLDSGHLPATSAFTVTQNNAKYTVSNVAVTSGDTVVLTLGSNLARLDNLKVSYTAGKDPAALQDNAGNNISSFAQEIVVKPIALTLGADNVSTSGSNNGLRDTTSENDIIYGTSATIQANDTINGGAGTGDILRIDGDISSLTLPTPANLTNVEVIDYVSPNNLSIDISSYAVQGVTTLQIEQAELLNGKTLTTGLGTSTLNLATSINPNTKLGIPLAGNLTWAATAATDKALNLVLNGYQSGLNTATAKNLTITDGSHNATTLNINSTGPNGSSNQAGTITAPSTITTHVLTGDKDLSYTVATMTGITKIDASRIAANTTVNTSAGTNTFQYVGSAKNDILVIDKGSISANLDGGAGTDTLYLSNTGSYSPADIAKLSAVKNFETIAFADGATANLTLLNNTSVKNIAVKSGTFVGNSKTIFNVDNSTDTGHLTINNRTGEYTANVVLNNDSGASHTIDSLTLGGVNNITLTSTGAVGSANVITNFNNGDNTAITLKGDKALTLGLDGTSAGNKVDASALTAALNLTVSAGGDIVTGTKLADIFHFGSAIASPTYDVFTTLNSLTKGDQLDLGGGTSFSKISINNAANLYEALDQAAAGTAGQVNWFQFDKNTYILRDTNVSTTLAATDVVVKIAGLVDLTNSTWDGAAGTLTY